MRWQNQTPVKAPALTAACQSPLLLHGPEKSSGMIALSAGDGVLQLLAICLDPHPKDAGVFNLKAAPGPWAEWCGESWQVACHVVTHDSISRCDCSANGELLPQ